MIERESGVEYVLSLSYGKDSIACLEAIRLLGYPLDRIVHAEVWATDTIPADLPPMVEFKKKADKIILDRYGIKVEHLCAMRPEREKATYEYFFYKILHSRKGKEQIYGFPITLGAWCNDRLKVNVLSAIERGNRKKVVRYLGIAADEPERVQRHITQPGIVLPLVDIGWEEAYCRKWCEENNLLSPIYTTSARGGCWFCHNQNVDQLRILRKNYPELWRLLLKWDKDSPITFKPGHTVRDFEQRFWMEDEGKLIPGDKKFRWQEVIKGGRRMTFDLGTMLGAPMNNNVQVQQIPVDMLEPYHNHKFQLYTGERLDDMVDSIQKNGVLNPIIVQPIASGRYEILIGHNRWNASKLAGKPVVPAIIKTGLSEEEAEMYVIESNLMQRGFDNLRISEQAAVLAMRHKEMFSQGKRNDIIRELQLLENPQLAAEDEADKKHQTTSDKVGAEYGMSRNSVARLLRIDTLHDTIKEWVDAGLSIRAGVELSYINPDGQELLVEYMQRCTVPETDTNFSVIRKLITEKAAKTLREAFQNGLITEPDDIPIVLEKPVKTATKPLKIDSAIAQRYFTKGESQKEISATIEKALELYFSQQSESQEEECELDGYGLSDELLKLLKKNGKKNIDDVREWMLCGNGEDTLSPELWDEVYVLLDE
ncbi:MAG: ParB N-terminal domain-containing protein [Ruminococcus sp.]|nr:ParB N-terminal domain-containing protein [Ruminococcus sp.]